MKHMKLKLLLICICLVTILSFASYTLYLVNNKEEVTDPKEVTGLAVLVDGEKTDTFPTKDSGKVFDKIECTNGGEAEWNDDTWKLAVRHINHSTECTVSFITKVQTGVEKLTELAKTNTTELFTDDTLDHNIRYMGANPANYVDIGNGTYDEEVYRGFYSNTSTSFREYPTLEACQKGINEKYNINCTKIQSKEDPILWRIIGVMNNVDDGTGVKETRIKLIREKSVEKTAWDRKCTGTYDESVGTCSSTAYNGNWVTASLNKTLNGAFYNSTKTADPNYANVNGSYKWQKLDYSTIGLGSINKGLIGDAVYHLGGPTSSNYAPLTASGYYEVERSNTTYSGNPVTWTGKIGLMYPSDYGYATSGGPTKNKEACATKELSGWAVSDYADCKNNDWLLDSTQSQWTMIPGSSHGNMGMGVAESGSVNFWFTLQDASGTHPVFYLKSNVKIIDGDGTKENPYKLGI